MRATVSWFMLLASTLAAAAQQPPAVDPADLRALAANYQLSNADGERKCPITLDPEPAGPGFTLKYEREACVKLFAFLAEVRAWRPGPAGSIRFVRQDGRMIAEFTEGVDGEYEAIREGDAVYFLANLQFVDPKELAQPADVIGDWTVARPNGPPLCRLHFSDQPSQDEGYQLRVEPGCDPALASFAPVSWRLDRGDVVLQSQTGDKLRFGRREGGGWAKVPERPGPLVMTRP
jgi:hypothetical protein